MNGLGLLHRTVLDIARESGADAVTSRGIAERAGVSPSYVNYKFGGLARLLKETQQHADAVRGDYWKRSLDQLKDCRLSLNDLAALIFLKNRSALLDYGGAEDVFWSSVFLAARGHENISSVSSLKQEHAFWTYVADSADGTHVQSDILLAFSLALRFSYLVFEKQDDFDPWALALVGRFSDRLKGYAPSEAKDSAFRRQYEMAVSFETDMSEPGHETARKIIQTTADLMTNDGVAAVSHRKIAAAGGVSVSSVQHFFGSRQNYVRAAFQEIYRRIVARSVPEMPQEKSMSIDDLMAQISKRVRLDQDTSLKEFGAMMNLTLAAAYDQDSGDIARALIARGGETSGRLLRVLSDPRGKIGRLDGQLFSMISNQAYTLHICADSAGLNKAPDVGLFGARVMKSLFG